MIHPPPRQGARPLQHRRGVVLQREVDAPRPVNVHTGALIAAVEVHLPQLGLLPRFDQGKSTSRPPSTWVITVARQYFSSAVRRSSLG